MADKFCVIFPSGRKFEEKLESTIRQAAAQVRNNVRNKQTGTLALVVKVVKVVKISEPPVDVLDVEEFDGTIEFHG